MLEECSPIKAGEGWSDLSLLYGLMKSVEGGLPPVIQQFDEAMKRRGEMLLKSLAPGPEGPKSSDEFVNRIMSFHAKNIKIIKQGFEGNQYFIGVLDKTCMSVINHNPNPKTHCHSLDLVRYLFVLLFNLFNRINIVFFGF